MAITKIKFISRKHHGSGAAAAGRDWWIRMPYFFALCFHSPVDNTEVLLRGSVLSLRLNVFSIKRSLDSTSALTLAPQCIAMQVLLSHLLPFIFLIFSQSPCPISLFFPSPSEICFMFFFFFLTLLHLSFLSFLSPLLPATAIIVLRCK